MIIGERHRVDADFEKLSQEEQKKINDAYAAFATDPEVRSRIMGNRTAGRLLERLKKMRDADLHFHAQVVLCPELNDGSVLDRTLDDLYALYPAAQSLAIVPVGLTKFRDGLYPLRPYTSEEARAIIAHVECFQEKCRETIGTSFAFLSDEWYLHAGLPLPEYRHYEAFDQIENGVGLLRLFEDDFLYALEEKQPLEKQRHVCLAGGTGCHAFFAALYKQLEPYGITIDCFAVRNDFFGGNVNVAGLVTGSDLMEQLRGRLTADTLLIPKNMLREKEDVFLDDITVTELEEALHVRVIPFGSGEDLINIVFGEEL